METEGLIPGTELRPADVLTTAVGAGGYTAGDLSVASPDAIAAGDDACESRVGEKHDKYDPHDDALARQGIKYRPLVISAFGRFHPDFQRFIRELAGRIARRRGTGDPAAVEAAMRVDLAVALWRRNARQLQHCLPGPDPDCPAGPEGGRGRSFRVRLWD